MTSVSDTPSPRSLEHDGSQVVDLRTRQPPALRPIPVAYLIGGATVGGTERHLLELLRGIDRRRFEPLVIFIKPGGPLREAFRSLGVPLLDLALEKSYSFRAIRRLLGLAWELRRRRIAVLHAYHFHGSLYASLAGLLGGVPRLIVCERGEGYRDWRRVVARRFYYRRAYRILVNCEAMRDYVRECCPSEGKILKIPNGIDRGQFRRHDSGRFVRSRLNIPISARVIGSIGRLLPVKGHTYLVEAFIAVCETSLEAHLLIVGDGPLEEDLLRRLRRAGLHDRVRFVGYQDDVRPYLEAMDYFVLPSLSEAHSMALLEAMAMGKAIVATSVGGNSETVQSEVTGILVPPASSDALREALLRLLNEPELAERLGEGAKREAARYDLREIVKRYEDLYLAPRENLSAGGGTR